MKTLTQFVIDTLLPFKNNPDLCAIDYAGTCSYLTEEGKKCAVGVHIREDFNSIENLTGSATTLFMEYKIEEVLTEEALSYKLTPKQWEYIQNYHDKIALGSSMSGVNDAAIDIEESLKINLTELKFS